MLLTSPIRKAVLAALVLGLCSAYVYVAGRDYLASRLAAARDSDGVAAATRLEPGNARYADLLGRHYFYATLDVPKALGQFQQATSLNPGMAQYWMDLALAYSAAGDTTRARAAVERGLAADPTTPEVAWDAANFYFALGDYSAAFAQLRRVFQYQPWSALDGMQLAWRATRDPAMILREALPDDPGPRLTFLNFLLQQNQPEAAAQVWAQVASAGRPFEAKLALPYVQYLLDQKQVEPAQKVWRELGSVDRSFSAYLSSSNLMVNGGFEQEMLNNGFDWRYQPLAHVNLAIDSTETHGGEHALMIGFDGGPVREVGFWQLLPVQPGASYELSAWSQAREWAGVGGLRLVAEDAFDRTPLGSGELLATTAGWRQSSFAFTARPQTTLVMVKLVRDPAGEVLAGRFWLDDVALNAAR